MMNIIGRQERTVSRREWIIRAYGSWGSRYCTFRNDTITYFVVLIINLKW